MYNDEDIFNNQDADMFSGLYAVLCFLGSDYISRIPKEYFTVIKECRNREYVPVIYGDKPPEEQGFREDTLAQIMLLKLSFWCDTKEEQQRYWDNLIENEIEISFGKVGGIHIVIDEPEN